MSIEKCELHEIINFEIVMLKPTEAIEFHLNGI